MRTFRTIQPLLAEPLHKVAAFWASFSGSSATPGMNTPMRRIRSRRCARPATGQAAAAAPPMMTRAARSFDHLVGPGEQRRRHLEAERLGCFELQVSLQLVGSCTGKSAGLVLFLGSPIYILGHATELYRSS